MSDWTEVKIIVDAKNVDKAGDIASMVVPYGIYIEDYSELEKEAWEIAHIDLIDEDLLQKDRTRAIVHVYIAPQENPQEAVAFLRERYSAEGIDSEILLNQCRNEDWENNWKQYFHPIPVGEKLLIRPTWEDEYEAGDRKVLNIEPGLAFGTGTHETTRLCLQTLEKYIEEGTTVLDIGCGSGILSLAALLLGAKQVTGVDIDALAVKTAQENGEANGFSEPEYKILQGNLTDKVEGKFDLVVANIVADVIIMFCKDVASFMKDDAVFITSGIIDTREQDVIDAFNKYSFEIKARHTEGGWVCFECKKA
ncbi:MAG: 50S ribosomal protein L11 methyltransferase [Acutalibacteraceae bacterium]|nr:50S ribosomal protein L11 methyltransferase [Acutalibacteraceae bacterium]